MKGKIASYFRSTALAWLISAAVACLVLFLLSISGSGAKVQNFKTIGNIKSQVEARLDLLEDFTADVLDEQKDPSEAASSLPKDMVIYLYSLDTLSFWAGQFPIVSEEFKPGSIFPVLEHSVNVSGAPLQKIGEEYSFMSIGGKWYITFKTVSGPRTALSALEVVGGRNFSSNRINRNIVKQKGISVIPCLEDEGFVVDIHSRVNPANRIPVFKITSNETVLSQYIESPLSLSLKCLFILFMLCFFLCNLRLHRNLKNLVLAVAMVWTAAFAFVTVASATSHSILFSPMLYASGDFMSSLGALIIYNFCIILTSVCFFRSRKYLEGLLLKPGGHSRLKAGIFLAVVAVSTVLIGLYIHTMLRSLILNSNISFSLDGHADVLLYYCLATYSFLLLFFCLYMVAGMLRLPARTLFGWRKDYSPVGNLVVFAVIVGVYLTTAQSLFGKEKEESRIEVWSNLLSVDRDLKLEIMLRGVEQAIGADEVISNLIRIEGGDNLVQSYISDHYFPRLQDPYFFTIHTSLSEPEKISAFFNSNAHNYTPIAPGSSVMFLSDGASHGSYAAAFSYPGPNGLSSWLLIEIRMRQGGDQSVYSKLLSGSSALNRVDLPSQYSYARYIDGRLADYGGLFAYPTYLDHHNNIFAEGKHIVTKNGYVHHRHETGQPGEVIIISRIQRVALTFILDFVYAVLLFLLSCSVFMIRKPKKRNALHNSYFRKRINYVIVLFLLLGLVTMGAASVFFVYNRNQKNLRTLMSDRIVTIKSLLEAKTYSSTPSDLTSLSFKDAFNQIATNARTDLSLYSTSGKVFMSTNQDVYESMVLPSRIDSKAFRQIMTQHQRYFISPDEVNGQKFYSLYAPVQNGAGDVLAIVCAPYSAENYTFMEDAFSHAAAMMSLFLILIALSVFMSRRTVRSLFRPLVVMGLRMTRAQNDGLKEIVYERNDEIKTIVDSYNLMVRELEKSSKLLAENERDKAWSEMARQVAHEIKNPLTPIKLEIQRLIRAKARGDEAWSDKFEPAMKVVLEHIDILADTANEFSTFAKLYSQESTRFDLDRELSEQVMLFNNRENVTIEYLGMSSTEVVAPKPQIIRVCVNLLSNAIQAVEGREDQSVPGRVYVSLRQSATREDAVDIVFDDNGPGVSEENISRLFTPNFTTKSSGTGLGLAICNSIIAKCGGSISYSKSFTLSGACFTVVLPKNSVTENE